METRRYTFRRSVRNRMGWRWLLALANGTACAAVLMGTSIAGASSDWDSVVAAAKKEGKVVVGQGGAAGAELRRLIINGFEKQFPGITVDFTVAGGGSLAPRILTERRTGQYLWDVYMGGTTTSLTYFMPAGVLDPIRPALILPEVKDPGKWFGGKLDFADDGATYNLVFGGYVKPPLVFYAKSVKKADIHSYKDLLDPKWRGKIVMMDPRRPGSGMAEATFWYGTEELGKDFIRRLFVEQNVKIARDYRQQMEWLARGDYLIAIGHHNDIYKEFRRKGLPLDQLTANDLKESNFITAAIGSVNIINQAAHPNAAKVFINWLLSRDTQTQWSRITGYWSRRRDVPTDHLDPALIPEEDKMSSYQLNYKEEWVTKQGEILKFLRTLIQ